MVETVLMILALACAVFLVAVWLTPTTVQYTETLVIETPARDLYDHTRLQARLMQWSAWPSETGSTCECENTDGEVGARTVFFSKGQRFGYQEVTRLVDGQSVELSLFSKGPPQKPVLRFDFLPISPSQTEVHLIFQNTLARPFNVILRLAGIVRWTRKMHLKDLQGLKRYSEPPFLTYVGKQVTTLHGRQV
jgi:hypothetical protein